MKNSLGLDVHGVHGAAESQEQGQPSDTTRSTASPPIEPKKEDTEFSWGVSVDTTEPKEEDTEFSWGVSVDTTEPKKEDTGLSWGVSVDTTEPKKEDAEFSWGVSVDTAKRGDSKRDTDINWGQTLVEDSWGSLEEASTTVRVDKSRKETNNRRSTLEDGNTTQRDDRLKKDKGTPYVPAAPPARVSTKYP